MKKIRLSAFNFLVLSFFLSIPLFVIPVIGAESCNLTHIEIAIVEAEKTDNRILMDSLLAVKRELLEKQAEFEKMKLERDDLIADQWQDTGIPKAKSRLWLNKHFIDEFDRYRVSTLTMIAVDIDSFGKINDNYGHVQADDILIRYVDTMAKSIENLVRMDEAVIVRHGGEEFYIVLINTGKDRIPEITEALRAGVENNKRIFSGLDPKDESDVPKGRYYNSSTMTHSLGVVTMSEIPDGPHSFAAVTKNIERLKFFSDQQEGQSKLDGKNRVSSGPDLKWVAE